MLKKTIVVIDNDSVFLGRFKSILEENGALSEYNYYDIAAKGETTQVLSIRCIEEINELKNQGQEICVMLVDIVIIENDDDNPSDRSGVQLAHLLGRKLPNIPLVGITRFIKAYRLLSEITFEHIFQGVVVKHFVEKPGFMKSDMKRIIEQAKLNLRYSSREVEIQDNVKTKYQFSPDDSLAYQISQIGENNLLGLLDSLFPVNHGTVSFLSPGFSGAFVFKVTTNESITCVKEKAIRHWVIKVSQNIDDLNKELHSTIEIISRVNIDNFAVPLHDYVNIFGKWGAIAFELKEDIFSLAEYVNITSEAIIISDVIPRIKEYLTHQHIDKIMQQCFPWKTYLNFSKRVKSSLKILINDVLKHSQKRISDEEIIKTNRLIKFITSDSSTEPAIASFETNCPISIIHGDMNSRNILVTRNGKKISIIDFANINNDLTYKDIAKLEVDLVLLGIDSTDWSNFDWSRLNIWDLLMPIYDFQNMTNQQKLPIPNDPEIQKYLTIILSLRKVLTSLDLYNPRLYSLVLLHTMLCTITYQDVSIPKKLFGLKCANTLLETFFKIK